MEGAWLSRVGGEKFLWEEPSRPSGWSLSWVTSGRAAEEDATRATELLSPTALPAAPPGLLATTWHKKDSGESILNVTATGWTLRAGRDECKL